MNSLSTQSDVLGMFVPVSQDTRFIPREAHQGFHHHGTHLSMANFSNDSPSFSQKFNTVLLLCDENSVKMVISQFLEQERFRVVEAAFDDLSTLDGNETFAAVLIDLGLNSIAVETLFSLLNRYLPDIPVVLMDEVDRFTEHKEFCKKRAFSYLTKPCNRTELLRDLRFAVKNAKVVHENRQLRLSLGFPTQLFELYGMSNRHEMFRKKINTYSRLDGPILIVGEKGTGKGVTVQHLHLGSSRAKNPLIVVPCDSLSSKSLESLLFGHVCGALPEFPGERLGVLEIADHGTVYLDRINEMPLSIQTKICQFLKDHTVQWIGSKESCLVNTRIIAGSSVNLSLACLHGRFHEELYYRLNSMLIDLPPLREQVEDIPAFAKGLVTRYAKQNQTSLQILSHPAIAKLQKYSWPGNMREFKNVIYRACALAKDTVINETDIVFDTLGSPQNSDEKLGLAGMTMAEIERRAIIETIHACGGNRAESARQLGVSEKTIYNKFRQFKLKGVV